MNTDLTLRWLISLIGLLAWAATGMTGMAMSAAPSKAVYAIDDCWWSAAPGDTVDADEDGTPYQRVLVMDADTDESSALVYLVISYRLSGTTHWLYYTTISYFTINGSSRTDSQRQAIAISTYMNGSYDIKVDLYTAADDVQVASRDFTSDSDLNSQLFECGTQDNPVAATIWDCWWDSAHPQDQATDGVDLDGDHFARQRTLYIDASQGDNFRVSWVYVKIFYRVHGASAWLLESQTEPFLIPADISAPTPVKVVIGSSHFSHAPYEFKVDLFETEGNNLVATRAPDIDGELNDILFETVAEDTPAPSSPGQFCFKKQAYSTVEGTKLTLLVNRVNGSSGTASVHYTTKQITASTGRDYRPVSGLLTWQDGDSSPRKIQIKILLDAEAEGVELVKVLLKKPSGATLTSPSISKISIQANSRKQESVDDDFVPGAD